ncbi:solute carrier family 20 (sodium-dependent phosphate transporter) [Marchantia polymorpha subsp. ruderalis]|uniref:Phosphate transporter n=2 Tax=Marchantia polymorpha TaxID=3197 RepID=A0A176VW44_MARPO|nr:hypothetical protein AXG93_523s1250 [Marchantia polymorpha subsp. ruderalis]PTQ30277.1 hypothetical protein MARPO_0126s0002 [Marchantia polymorpha]PTQ30278.1 hypothetical protein MARPO_0126s0002 [Marchantia polymorpha]PTQ30280.1 hypothetical protein MARPO_0126s0002 [Marchantia polymorpha]BBN09461.1 hypothetical protein Mp_4g19920 [Marchantia polymorpha subsp. ruderalis]|eukprot:PTQ30277.1 hypothetical protein MARPO_0126s0002 [Marchantia polymorpha]
MAVLEEYLWLVVVGALVAFGFGYGTGANDVANAFGTSVGSKTLTLRQAVIIASIFEFAGALLLGRVSTNTIASGIADINSFTRDPEVYAYGMVCALGVGTIWLLITSYLGLNVSSTHSIIGGIIGFALVWDGSNAVVWAKKDTNSFPPYKGVVAIVMSWFIAPVITGLVSAFIFFVVRTAVLRRKNAYALSFWTLPPFVLITTWVNMYFVFTKGAKKTLSSSSDWTDSKAAWVSAVIAAGVTILCIFVALPLLRRMASNHFDSEGNAIQGMPTAFSPQTASEMRTLDEIAAGSNQVSPVDAEPAQLTRWQKFSKAATHGMDVDIHKIVKTDDKIHEIHESAELFEPRVEYAFSYLQVFSAICVIFAHGAGEVGYMAGPLATIWDVYKKGQLSKNVQPPIWVILIGAIGLVIGLATYGYNVTRAMGVKLAKLTPTRGFAAELATAFVIMIASQYGLPTSSSQCITGAIIGVGILEGSKGVNWTQFLKQFASWVATLFVIGLAVAAVFAQGIYTPSKIQGKEVTMYEDRVTNLTTQVYKDFNSSLQSYRPVAAQGLLVNLPNTTWNDLNATVAVNANAAKNLIDPKKTQSVAVESILDALYKSLSLVQNNSVFTLGQSTVFPGADICIDPSTTNLTTVACTSPKLLPSFAVKT